MSEPAAAFDAPEDETERYYEANASLYAAATFEVDMSAVYQRFLRHLPEDALILDAGSGSGRDTLAFVQRGYRVEAFDSSPSLSALSTALTGIHTQVLRFQDLTVRDRYDGIWACASLLHVSSGELKNALARLAAALKAGGAMYMSFKEGSRERVAPDGRLFLDMSEDRIREILADLPQITLTDVWMSEGEGSHKGKAEWLNVIAAKAAEEGGHAR